MALHFGKRENELNTKPLNNSLNSSLNTPRYGSAASAAPAAKLLNFMDDPPTTGRGPHKHFVYPTPGA